MRFNFYASTHKCNSDNLFDEGMIFNSYTEALAHGRGLCEIWGCKFVNVYEDGELVDSVEPNPRMVGVWARPFFKPKKGEIK
ncbi:MAG: hypothetical protein QMD05_08625 [Candidatus Brocadiaceae bacterium]|nr:hypothetical protein [Candidatus Brocadiaceae bacterium]